MSVIHITEAQKDLLPEHATVHQMLTENGKLIETIAEYQRMGRVDEATKYHELLHKNLMYLAKLADSEIAQQLQQVNNKFLPLIKNFPSYIFDFKELKTFFPFFFFILTSNF